MDTAEIEVFLVLADELHFGRTADRLRLPQPQVSRLIARLERRAGGALFNRTSRRVTLTPLGDQLRSQLQPGYEQITGALAAARVASRGVTGQLRLGCPYTVAGAALIRLVKEFCARYRDCELTMHVVEARDPYAPLRRGEIDAEVNWLIVDEQDLTTGPVIDYRDRVLAMGRGHRLAARESVCVEDLGDEETHENSADFPDALFDVMVPRFTPSGRPIRRTYPWRDDEDVLTAVARGRIVHPGMRGTALAGRTDLVLVPFSDLPPMPLGLIWCTAHENARIRALAATAAAIGPRPPGPPPSPAGNGHPRAARPSRPPGRPKATSPAALE
jgi:DNA-binding transcriptional LysR family regulator